MTKHEYLTQLAKELRKRHVADAADVLSEYEQHFAFRLADGCPEEEVAAQLGSPAELAAQFEPAPQPHSRRSALLTWLWLVWVDLLFGTAAIVLLSVDLALVCLAGSCALVGVCLVLHLGVLPFIALPATPYGCALLFGLSLLALFVLSGAGCVWLLAFTRQIFHAYGRFHANQFAPCRGDAPLPGLPLRPQFSPKTRHRLRTAAPAALAAFVVLGALACLLAVRLAGAPDFWAVWGWFGPGGLQ